MKDDPSGLFTNLSAYAGDHACVPKLLLVRCFDGVLRRAGTALVLEECVTPDRISVSDDCVMLRRISLIGGRPTDPLAEQVLWQARDLA